MNLRGDFQNKIILCHVFTESSQQSVVDIYITYKPILKSSFGIFVFYVSISTSYYTLISLQFRGKY